MSCESQRLTGLPILFGGLLGLRLRGKPIFLCGTGRPGAVNESSGAGPFCILKGSIRDLGKRKRRVPFGTAPLDPSNEFSVGRNNRNPYH
jgi:hypothetical protein